MLLLLLLLLSWKKRRHEHDVVVDETSDEMTHSPERWSDWSRSSAAAAAG